MGTLARFVHINIVAKDWRRLAQFYQEVFGCIPVPPERNLSGDWLEKGTAVASAEIHGIHLRLPGCDKKGPTLEIFQYNIQEKAQQAVINRPGFAHIAFAVDDVEAARDEVIAAGGFRIGELITVRIPGAGLITFVYVADPEGNIIELQRWRY